MSSFRKRLPEYVEPLALLVFLGVLGYLFLSTAPEQALQAVSFSTAAPSAAPEAEPTPSSSSDGERADEAAPVRLTAEAPQAPVRDDFGLRKGAFRVETGRVAEHQTFADLLTEAGVSYAKAVALAEEARPTFDVRYLQAGKHYRLYRRGGDARHLVYQRGPVRYVSFALGDSLAVHTGERPVRTVERVASGTIESSLYRTIGRAGADPSLAQALAKVYAWQIDFFRLQPGDGFRVIYEEERVGGEAIGVGRILGARFDHRGDAYYGIYLDGEKEYFDEENNSLRKSLLKAPLEFVHISSRFQKRRLHPVQKRWKAHRGTDYAAERGTPVYSVGDGRVVKAGYDRANGNWVKIRHNDKYTTGYLHFSKIAEGIEPGARVQQKQVIGYVGSTGLSTGPHVHFCFWKNGRLVDHTQETLPSAPPVADSLRAEYGRLKAEMLPRLRSEASERDDDIRTTTVAAQEDGSFTLPRQPSLLLSQKKSPLALPARQ